VALTAGLIVVSLAAGVVPAEAVPAPVAAIAEVAAITAASLKRDRMTISLSVFCFLA